MCVGGGAEAFILFVQLSVLLRVSVFVPVLAPSTVKLFKRVLCVCAGVGVDVWVGVS